MWRDRLIDNNYEGKIQAAIDFLKQGDFVYVHVEAPDECGHGRCGTQKTGHRTFDQCIVAPAVEAAQYRRRHVVTCDHLTPVDIRTHA